MSGLEATAEQVRVLRRQLESEALADHWARLDELVGPGYRRVGMTVETPEGIVEAFILVIQHPA